MLLSTFLKHFRCFFEGQTNMKIFFKATLVPSTHSEIWSQTNETREKINWERERDRERDIERKRERQTDRQTNRERETETDRDRQRQRQRETETEICSFQFSLSLSHTLTVCLTSFFFLCNFLFFLSLSFFINQNYSYYCKDWVFSCSRDRYHLGTQSPTGDYSWRTNSELCLGMFKPILLPWSSFETDYNQYC